MKNIENFISDLSNNSEFAEAFSNHIATVREGDWEEIARIGAKYGYSITPKELMTNVQAGFFKGFGKFKEIGWAILPDVSPGPFSKIEIETLNPSKW